MKKILLTGIAAALFGLPALAADMPVKAPIAAPYDPWTGCYIGGNIGGGRKTIKAIDSVTHLTLLDKTYDGWVGGGQIGCDSQLNNNWVVGARAMWDAADVKGTKGGILASTDTISAKASDFATLTAKLGYLINPTLQFYGEVGYGWLREKDTYNCNVCGPPQSSAPLRDNRGGVDVGFGVDWMFQRNWDLFVEYDHMWLGTRQQAFILPTAGAVATNKKEGFDKILVGLNYRFGTTR